MPGMRIDMELSQLGPTYGLERPVHTTMPGVIRSSENLSVVFFTKICKLNAVVRSVPDPTRSCPPGARGYHVEIRLRAPGA